jgi:hypothetical protein
VINKDPARAGSAVLQVSGAGSGYAAQASVSRLLAPTLSAKQGISLGGITYGDGAAQRGSPVAERVEAKAAAGGGGLEMQLYMPPGSAALVTLPRK